MIEKYYFDKVSSTQDLAKEYLNKNTHNIGVFIANSQTAGYGKRGRNFYSPENTGIYYSLAIPNSQIIDNDHDIITIAVAVFILKVLEDRFPNKNFTLKWVNDIYLDDKKIGGILTEKTINGLVIGVGINISTQEFPIELLQKAGAVTNKEINKEGLIDRLLNATLKVNQTFNRAEVINEYRIKCNTIGKYVTLKLGKTEVKGLVMSVDDRGCLVLNNGNNIHVYSSGEVIKVN